MRPVVERPIHFQRPQGWRVINLVEVERPGDGAAHHGQDPAEDVDLFGREIVGPLADRIIDTCPLTGFGVHGKMSLPVTLPVAVKRRPGLPGSESVSVLPSDRSAQSLPTHFSAATGEPVASAALSVSAITDCPSIVRRSDAGIAACWCQCLMKEKIPE